MLSHYDEYCIGRCIRNKERVCVRYSRHLWSNYDVITIDNLDTLCALYIMKSFYKQMVLSIKASQTSWKARILPVNPVESVLRLLTQNQYWINTISVNADITYNEKQHWIKRTESALNITFGSLNIEKS